MQVGQTYISFVRMSSDWTVTLPSNKYNASASAPYGGQFAA